MVPLLADAIMTRIEQCAREGGAGQQCLDVGCGEQPLRLQLTSAGFKYFSMDVQQNATGTVDYIGRIDGTLPEELSRRRFELVVCTEVLEHVADWTASFANLARLLRPGGKLLITCPHIWVPHEEPTDFYRPTSWGLAYHAKSAGLKPIEVTRLGDGYDVLGTVLAATRLRAPDGRPWMWLLVGPAALLRKATLKLLSCRRMKSFMDARTGLYLSTIALFQKD